MKIPDKIKLDHLSAIQGRLEIKNSTRHILKGESYHCLKCGEISVVSVSYTNEAPILTCFCGCRTIFTTKKEYTKFKRNDKLERILNG